ncbi:MAG TPA: TolC family protein [Gemmatimonadales bacterium]|jgi:outer membrane protein TolC|nr:TolC family protein [Gemmatimonadales bacterium]
MKLTTVAAALAVAAGVPIAALRAQQPLTLERAVQMAQEQGYQGRAATAARDAARFRDRSFYAGFLPQLSLGGTLPRYNRAIIPVLQPDGSTLFRPQNQTDAGLTATLSQRLPTGGDLFVSSSLTTFSISGDQTIRTWSSTPVSLGIRQSLFRPNTFALDRRERPLASDLAERQYLASREELAGQTTGLFFDVYSAGVLLRNATANAAVNDTLYTLNKGRFEVGKIGENDLLQSELALLRARTAVEAARLEYTRAQAALRLAISLPEPAPLDLVIPVDIPAYTPDSALAVRQAVENGVSASSVALNAAQADRRVSEAKLNNGFSATVQASVGFNATAPEMGLAYQNLLQARQATVSVELPLFTWGTGSNAVKAAESDREQTANLGRSALEQAAQAARFAALRLPLARTNLILSAKADTVAAKRFEVAYNRYVIGRIAIDNLYLAQSEKDQASSQYVQALRDYWVAHYRLRALTLYDFEAGKPLI